MRVSTHSLLKKRNLEAGTSLVCSKLNKFPVVDHDHIDPDRAKLYGISVTEFDPK